jgi:hypothetical protein
MKVGKSVAPSHNLEDFSAARVGWDIVILKRGTNPALGHVGVFGGYVDGRVVIIGGNQSNAMTSATFPVTDIVSVRRLKEAV